MGLMLVVFLVGSTPPEHIHDLFAHHEDGVDPQLKDGQFVLMAAHHHCSFLGFEFTPFVTTETEYLFFEHISHENTWLDVVYHFQFSASHKVISLRGPPAVAS